MHKLRLVLEGRDEVFLFPTGSLEMCVVSRSYIGGASIPLSGNLLPGTVVVA